MQPDQKQGEGRKAAGGGLTGQIAEARTAKLSLYVIAERSDYAPLRITGQKFSLSGENVFSTDERKQAQDIADKLNAHYQAKKLDRHVEVLATLAWRARRVERLVEQLATAEMVIR